MMTRQILERQLEKRLARWRGIDGGPPAAGWIRTIRQALGMSGSQLAARAGMTRQLLAGLEASERKGTISLASLRKLAQALNCDVVYALVPKHTLSSTIEEAANVAAREELARVGHTMRLEAQDTDATALEDLVRERTRELMADRRALWNHGLKRGRDHSG